MDKKFWSFAAASDGATDLYIETEIAGEESWWADTTTPQQFRRELSYCRGEVRVWLNSPGGDAFAGAAIYDLLREYASSGRGRVVAMVSMAASAASLIAMAADEIRISIVGTMMIHEPWALTAGKSSALRATAEVLETVRDAQIEAYSKRTGNSRERILELMNAGDGQGTYMSAREAIEMGFADGLMHEDEGKDMDAGAKSVLRAMDVALIRSCLEGAATPPAKPAAEEADPEEPPANVLAEIESQKRALLRACLENYVD